ncbi:lipoyltransferase [Ascodesmis nigricans]|uniref:Octanoyltransferase n=1 Tax=Ascodesmis nigricans TaxID=341454 RepID=A0A4S2N3M4_9PEZI|nr:lipoyltransferase [Ascodesmis nigricans]
MSPRVRPDHLLHLPLAHAPFARATTLQSIISTSLQTYKTKGRSALPRPPPTLITSEFSHPVYTLGRRDAFSSPPNLPSNATVVHTQRGGQTTYHGPGQLTAYLVADIKNLGFTPRCWIHMLEQSVIDTLDAFKIPAGRLKEFPGVWVAGGKRKICAVGVHMRRNVASYGVGLNVGDQTMRWFQGVEACGLPGEMTTCMEREIGPVDIDDVREMLADCVRARLKLPEVIEGTWREYAMLLGGKLGVKEFVDQGLWEME